MPRKEPGFAERLQTAAKAKKARLEKIRAMALANRVPSAQRQTAQLETAEARKDAERVVQADADATLKKNQKTVRNAKYAARKARQK